MAMVRDTLNYEEAKRYQPRSLDDRETAQSKPFEGSSNPKAKKIHDCHVTYSTIVDWDDPKDPAHPMTGGNGRNGPLLRAF